MNAATPQHRETLCPGCFEAPASPGTCPHCGFDPHAERPMLALPPHTRLNGQFVIGRVLGKPGGFGITYLAYDAHLATRVAIKEYLPRDLATRDTGGPSIHPHTADERDLFRYGRDQFLQEARILARLDHPNIVRVRQFFEANGSAYLVMDYHPGRTLADYLDRQPEGRLAEPVALALIHPVLDALRAVHGAGLLHRDIKPQNVYLARTGQGGARPLLLDFGAARQAFAERSQSVSVMLTAGFAPLEQYGRRGQTEATDLYAAAALLYRMTTGVLPPPAPERLPVDEMRPPTDFGVSPAVSAVILRAMAVAAKDRPQSVDALQAMLTAAASGHGPPPLPPTVGPSITLAVSPAVTPSGVTTRIATGPAPGAYAPGAGAPLPPAEDLEAVIGPNNTGFYLERFARFPGRPFLSQVSWNWPCFFLNIFWFFYRKMWLFGGFTLLAETALAFVALATLGTLIYMVTPISDEGMEGIANLIWFAVAGILVPMYANAIYLRHARRLIRKADSTTQSPAARLETLRRWGGVSKTVKALIVLLLVVVPIIGILAAIAVPSYQDYTQRARVTEAMTYAAGYKAAIAEHALAQGEWPSSLDALGLPEQVGSGPSALDLALMEGGILVAAFAEGTGLEGSGFALVPTHDDGTITWACVPVELPERYAPTNCRE